ncbi:hypothetical protein [Nocardia brasiliensis]|uniref:hypothetical protein n=1 Tax=Nocardia brasiliensis TaxID=37326 RepID=UPI0024551A5D|nr:hypothetical protein [Nocardia brasiliensis]
MITTLLDKALAAISPKELYHLGASAVAIPILLSVLLGDQIGWDTALSAGSAIAGGADWSAAQAWAEQARTWITDPGRVNAITMLCPVLIWITVGLNHVRLRGQRPVFALPTAVYCAAALIEVGAARTAWTSLAIGVALSVLPELNRYVPIRSACHAASITLADFISTVLRIPADLYELLYNLRDRQAPDYDTAKRVLPEPVSIPHHVAVYHPRHEQG